MAVLLFVASGNALAEARAWFDRASMYLDETVSLNVQVDEAARGTPDLSPLAANFRVLGTASSTQIQAINGQSSTTTTWSITLEPLRVGTLTVPALTVGGQTTQPATIEVRDTPVDGDFSADEDIVIEVEASPTDPYVQAQVDVVVRLFYALTLLEGSLGEPNTEGAVIQRVEGDVTYDTERDGRRYRVTERRYALFPERSGEIEIPSLRFVGRVPETGRRASRIDQLLSRGRQVAKRSQPITLSVKAKPDAFPDGATWLPASSLALKELWPDGAPAFRVGEPVTRNIVSEARGLLDTQLPEVAIPDVDGFKIYPDQSKSESRHDGNQIIARREQKMAMVPTRPGDLTLPEVRVPWWNTREDKLEWAVIPERTVTVAAATGASLPQQVAPTVGEAAASAPELARDTTRAAADGESSYWRWVSLGLAVLWVLTLALWLSGRARPVPGPKTASATEAETGSRRKVIAACKANDPHKAARALLAWASSEWDPAPRSIGELAMQLADQELRARVAELDRSLYRPNDDAWNGQQTAAHLPSHLKRRTDVPAARTTLPELWS